MPDVALPFLVLASAILWAAWRERAGGNVRDAKLLSAFGAGTLAAGGVPWMA